MHATRQVIFCPVIIRAMAIRKQAATNIKLGSPAPPDQPASRKVQVSPGIPAIAVGPFAVVHLIDVVGIKSTAQAKDPIGFPT